MSVPELEIICSKLGHNFTICTTLLKYIWKLNNRTGKAEIQPILHIEGNKSVCKPSIITERLWRMYLLIIIINNNIYTYSPWLSNQ